jgi:NADH-quinone oxidoreductase subunit J
MTMAFYVSGAVAVITTAIAITRRNAVHALLYLIVSLLSVALVFFTLGAPFAAALEAIIYAGAIMVLFVFVIMMLNPGSGSGKAEQLFGTWRIWIGPTILTVILAAEFICLFVSNAGGTAGGSEVPPAQVGIALLGPYVLGVELASMLLLAALVAAYHLGRRALPEEQGGGREGGI